MLDRSIQFWILILTYIGVFSTFYFFVIQDYQPPEKVTNIDHDAEYSNDNKQENENNNGDNNGANSKQKDEINNQSN
ncbi:hypothetical protein ACJ2A9_09845 [Anaerobacillus sp. MEB173]|uniref:hypothetical protein n=1 Tax=Anaerobacillus sp. MEB173 TaxID=3383345 RepID=UPI003F928DDD